MGLLGHKKWRLSRGGFSTILLSISLRSPMYSETSRIKIDSAAYMDFHPSKKQIILPQKIHSSFCKQDIFMFYTTTFVLFIFLRFFVVKSLSLSCEKKTDGCPWDVSFFSLLLLLLLRCKTVSCSIDVGKKGRRGQKMS